MRTFVMEPRNGTLETRAPISRPVDRDHALLEALRQGEPTAAERLVTTYGDRRTGWRSVSPAIVAKSARTEHGWHHVRLALLG